MGKFNKHNRHNNHGFHGNMYGDHNTGHHSVGFHTNGTVKTAKDEWTTGEEVKECKSCDYSTEDEFKVYIEASVMSAIFGMCQLVEKEWQMMLCGEVKDDKVEVTDYWVPKQEVSYSSVKNLDLIDADVIREKKIVATIHSHANMNVFFSSTDHDCTNMSLVKHHIVVNNKHEFVAKSRVDLPCGMVRFVKTSVVTSVIPQMTIKDFDNVVDWKTGSHAGGTPNSWTTDAEANGNVKDETPETQGGVVTKTKEEADASTRAWLIERGWKLDEATGIMTPPEELVSKNGGSYLTDEDIERLMNEGGMYRNGHSQHYPGDYID